MAVPRVLLAVSLLAAAVILPAAGAAPTQPPAGAIGMDHEGFTSKAVTVSCGETVTLVNNSRWVHIIGAGQNGRLADTNGVPMLGRRLMETNNVYTTGPWNTPGTYYLTCSVHPEMTVKVVVAGCDCCSHAV
jgi:plastocyanin